MMIGRKWICFNKMDTGGITASRKICRIDNSDYFGNQLDDPSRPELNVSSTPNPLCRIDITVGLDMKGFTQYDWIDIYIYLK